MKKIFIILILILIAGCGNPYYTFDEVNARLRRWQSRFDLHKIMTDELNRQENSFMKTLTDEELVCYELAVQAFRSRIQTSQELARRNLQATMSEDKYQSAMELLNTRVQICNETAALGREIKAIKEEGDAIGIRNERRHQAISDYMLRESIRNRNTQW